LEDAPKADFVAKVAAIALDFYRRGAEPGEPEQRVLGIRDDKAAAPLAFVHCLAVRLAGRELKTPEIALLEALARQGGKTIIHARSDLMP
jgi:hypothetical protein